MSVGQPCLFKNEVSMAKAKNTAFFCKECGYESSKWLGQCPECRQWNTFVEEPVVKQTVQGNIRGIAHRDVMPSVLSGISLDEEERTLTGYSELDRVLGGGIVRGSLLPDRWFWSAVIRVSENLRFFCRCAAILLSRRMCYTYRERNR